MSGYNVRLFGASGDGSNKDTQAIQRAIDTCGEAGGGTVVVPSGVYIVGTIVMRDHVNLHLDSGAVLRLSDDREDYLFPTQYEGKFSGVSYPAMIYGKHLRHVTISGKGRLDGQDEKFWTPLEYAENDIGKSMFVHFKPKTWRPMMLLFEQCWDVTVETITFERSPVYAGWMIECERLRIQGVSVQHHFHGPNTDGFHLSSCRHVRISDSDFHTGDDSIAIDGDGHGPAEHITITNCTFTSLNNMCRLFTGIDPWHDGTAAAGGETVRHVAISNCTVHNAAGALNLVAKNGTIEHVTVSNITLRMRLPGVPIFLMADQGTIRNVTISHLIAEANGVCTVSGKPGDVIDGIRITDCQFDIKPVPKIYGHGLPDPIPSYPAYHFAPYGIYLRHAREIELREIRINWLGELQGESWSALQGLDLDRLEINGFVADKAGSDNRVPAIRLTDVRRVYIDGCRTIGHSDIYLQVEGTDLKRIKLGPTNDFTLISDESESTIRYQSSSLERNR
ncbi:glycoside hydrolase family 28 protein [Paenibacillus sp. GYB003]|uniref:glycoside hydrolase family 28 protein n=1 Tax=Paenibacillus sp. GYB003 TaxID=2994392 RepID=UPI002F96A6BE